MKSAIPVAVGLAAGMAVGFFLGAMVARHDRPVVVIRNATDETLQRVMIRADLPKSYRFLRGYIPGVEGWSIYDMQPHQSYTARMSSHGPMALKVDATTAGGRELPSEKVNVASKGVVFASVSSDGITLQSERISF